MEDIRLSMSNRIRAVLEQRIIDGTLKPGERLIELNLAKEFDASQTPVREALRALETQRLIESLPYRGTFVRAISDLEMKEAYSVRGVLEQLAGELAAVRLNGQVEPLRRILEPLHAAAKKGDPHGYAEHNQVFHQAIMEAADNQVLFDSWVALNFEARVRVLLGRQPMPNLVERALEHDPIVDALEQGDGKTAGELLRIHASACLNRWLKCAKQNPTETSSDQDNPVPSTCLS